MGGVRVDRRDEWGNGHTQNVGLELLERAAHRYSGQVVEPSYSVSVIGLACRVVFVGLSERSAALFLSNQCLAWLPGLCHVA